MQIWILIGIGGFLGAIARYILGGEFQSSFTYFPAGTLAVNIIGSFLIGFIMFLAEFGGTFSEETRIMLTIGFLGSFTTMSTFSYECFKMLEENKILLFGANAFLTFAITILAVYLGKSSAIYIWSNLWS